MPARIARHPPPALQKFGQGPVTGKEGPWRLWGETERMALATPPIQVGRLRE